MTVRDEQRDRLRRTIGWARKVEELLAGARKQHLGEIHFRPASTGISMIGLRPDRPQRGKSGIKNLERLADEFDKLFREHCIECAHGRPTPEKRLQSYLVAEAYRNERRLQPLSADGSVPLLFVTDELSLPTSDGRIVCDLLALHGTRPVVIELKPAREMKRLVEQVTSYSALVEDHLDLFGELYSVILGSEVSLEAPCQRWIVWPAVNGHDRDPREDQLAELGIRVVGYAEAEGEFGFRTGRRVQRGPVPRTTVPVI